MLLVPNFLSSSLADGAPHTLHMLRYGPGEHLSKFIIDLFAVLNAFMQESSSYVHWHIANKACLKYSQRSKGIKTKCDCT